jgi:hypothetical protein
MDTVAMSTRKPDERPDKIDEVSRAIGELHSGIEGIIRTQADDRKFAAQYRTDIRKQMTEVADLVSGLVRDVSGMKPEVEISRQARLQSEANRAKRARRLKTAGALVGLTVSLSAIGRQVLDGLIAFWHYLWGVKPP